MIRAITFDFWDTIVADDSDEPRRAALGLPNKPQARLELILDEILQHHRTIQPEAIAQAFAQANERFRHAWKSEHRTPNVAARLQDVYDALKISRAPNFADVVRKIEDMEIIIPPTMQPNARETLEQLSQRYALAVISDTIHTPGRALRTLMEREGILQYFRAFLFSDEVGAAKPSPIVFERASKELGAPFSQMAHVGDRESNDVDGPLALGMKTILYTGVLDRGSANTRANAVCREFSELPRIIEKL
jgi:FMN phosphatase YigB (HAD superfamily)